MLVLVSFGLVLLATILLVVGLLTDDGLTLIYLSIGSSFAAAVVLALAFRRARPKQERATEPPAPLLPELAEHEEPPTSPVAETTSVPETATAPAPEVDVEPAPVAATDDWSTDDDWSTEDDWAAAGDFEVEFPIADYDELTVAEIMPLLPQLYSDELDVVAERERQGKNRATILARLEELAATGTDADAQAGAPAATSADATTVLPTAEPAAEPAPAPAPEPAPTRPAPAPRAPVPTPVVPSLSDDDDDELPFPIADYDQLTSDQIIPLLAQLEDDELEDVKAREAGGQARKSIIVEIDRQLGLVDAGTPAGTDDGWEPAPSAPSAPAPTPPAPEPAPRPAPVAEEPDSSVLAISGYDGLTVAQIRPLLSGLSEVELQAVLDHEVARDNRRTIVADIEKRLAGRQNGLAPAPEPARPSAATRKAAKRPAKRATKKAASSNHRFPIDDYDQLTVSQIRPKLSSLSKTQLEQVREREAAGANRKTVLTEIERRLS